MADLVMDTASAAKAIVHLLDPGNASDAIHEALDIDSYTPSEFKTLLRRDAAFDDYLDMINSLTKDEKDDLLSDSLEDGYQSFHTHHQTLKRAHVKQMFKAFDLQEKGLRFQSIWELARDSMALRIHARGNRTVSDDERDSGYGDSRPASAHATPTVVITPTLAILPANPVPAVSPPVVINSPESTLNTQTQKNKRKRTRSKPENGRNRKISDVSSSVNVSQGGLHASDKTKLATQAPCPLSHRGKRRRIMEETDVENSPVEPTPLRQAGEGHKPKSEEASEAKGQASVPASNTPRQDLISNGAQSVEPTAAKNKARRSNRTHYKVAKEQIKSESPPSDPAAREQHIVDPIQRDSSSSTDSDEEKSSEFTTSFPSHVARTLLASPPAKQWISNIDDTEQIPTNLVAPQASFLESRAHKSCQPFATLRVQELKNELSVVPASEHADLLSPAKSDGFHTAQEYQSSDRSSSDSESSEDSEHESLDHLAQEQIVPTNGTMSPCLKQSSLAASTVSTEDAEDKESATREVDAQTAEHREKAADTTSKTDLANIPEEVKAFDSSQKAQQPSPSTMSPVDLPETQAVTSAKQTTSPKPESLSDPGTAAQSRELSGEAVDSIGTSRPVSLPLSTRERVPLPPLPGPRAAPELLLAFKKFDKFVRFGDENHPTDDEETSESSSSSDSDDDPPALRKVPLLGRQLTGPDEFDSLSESSADEAESTIKRAPSFKHGPLKEETAGRILDEQQHIGSDHCGHVVSESTVNPGTQIRTFASFNSNPSMQDDRESSPTPDAFDPVMLNQGQHVALSETTASMSQDTTTTSHASIQNDGIATQSGHAWKGHSSPESVSLMAQIPIPESDKSDSDVAMCDASQLPAMVEAAVPTVEPQKTWVTSDNARISDYHFEHDPALGEYDPELHDGPRPGSSSSFFESRAADEAIHPQDEAEMANDQLLFEAGLLGDRESYLTPRRNLHTTNSRADKPRRATSPRVVIYKSPIKDKAEYNEHVAEDAESENEAATNGSNNTTAEPASDGSSPLDQLSHSPSPAARGNEHEEDDAADDEKPKKRKRKSTGKTSDHFGSLSPKKKRVPAGKTSKVAFPILSAPRFGLIQEELADDPFRLLLAVTFLNKTAGKSAVPVYRQLMEEYPTPEVLAEADHDDICDMVHHLGLQNQRAKRLKRLANTWIAHPPEKSVRYRTRDYPKLGDGRTLKPNDIVTEDTNDCAGSLEIAHIYGTGPYAWDSWRMFCRDVFRGVASGYNGEGTAAAGNGRHQAFEPEWKRVLPLDKELRACLQWMWLREGWIWDPLTGNRTVAPTEIMNEAAEREIEWEMAEEVIKSSNNGLEQEPPGTQDGAASQQGEDLVKRQLQSPQGEKTLEPGMTDKRRQLSEELIPLPDAESLEIAEAEASKGDTPADDPDTPPRSSIPSNTRQRSNRHSSVLREDDRTEPLFSKDQEPDMSSPVLERASRHDALRTRPPRMLDVEEIVGTPHEPQHEDSDSRESQEANNKDSHGENDGKDDDVSPPSHQAVSQVDEDPYSITGFFGDLKRSTRRQRERMSRNTQVHVDDNATLDEEVGTTYADRDPSEEL